MCCEEWESCSGQRGTHRVHRLSVVDSLPMPSADTVSTPTQFHSRRAHASDTACHVDNYPIDNMVGHTSFLGPESALA
jgi:hypothetical protein